MYQYVLYEQKERTAIITLNRPERRNSTSWEMLRDFFMAFQQFESDAEVRVGIITGASGSFCAGRDHKETAEIARMTDEQRKKVEEERRKWTAFLLRSMRGKPILTAVNGYAMGGGFALAMLGLLRVAAESATFQFPEVRVGLIRGYDLMQTQGIPLCVATELALGRSITAQRAYEVGLVNKVVPDAELMPTALEMAEYVASLPELALEYTIDGLERSRAIDLELRDLQARRTEKLKATDEAQEAARAFVEKRKPGFRKG